MSTNGLGLRRRRTSAHNKKNVPPAAKAVITPERHQSRRSPWSMTAYSIANPALAYRKPAKLGAGSDLFAAAGLGIPKKITPIMRGVISEEFQTFQCQERWSLSQP